MSLTLILVIMTGLISYQAFNNQSMKQQLMMHPVTVKNNGEYFRFLTNGFVHADWTHLLINMYVLYIFGEIVEGYFTSSTYFGATMGRVLYLGMYLGSIIIGAMPSFLKHQNNPSYAALGASGGTSGVMLAFAIFDPWAILLLFFIIPCPAIIAAVLYLVYSSWASKNSAGNIAHDAHLWGAVFGFIFTAAMILLFRADQFGYLMEQLLAGPSGLF